MATSDSLQFLVLTVPTTDGKDWLKTKQKSNLPSTHIKMQWNKKVTISFFLIFQMMIHQTMELLKIFSEKNHPGFCRGVPPSTLDRWRPKVHFPMTLKVKGRAWKANRNCKPFLEMLLPIPTGYLTTSRDLYIVRNSTAFGWAWKQKSNLGLPASFLF